MHVAVAKIICQLVRIALHISTAPATLVARVARSILARTFLSLPFSRNLDELERAVNAYYAADICVGLFIMQKFGRFIQAALEYQELQEIEKEKRLGYTI